MASIPSEESYRSLSYEITMVSICGVILLTTLIITAFKIFKKLKQRQASSVDGLEETRVTKLGMKLNGSATVFTSEINSPLPIFYIHEVEERSSEKPLSMVKLPSDALLHI
ncbi:hypothetical protein AOXY_G1022 [Acipenser oxyrinchus oxyrinchus]|uniref:Uncharacterized protein n=1 Tax=Acipenser oxyrinchus oxyrinchus TaxID=40147 RepID=A0AAD8GKW9_ACIOX|nr:hypothetical protein AOXY_G1022 [Acipenser oxyrinchus oxyrinchus]